MNKIILNTSNLQKGGALQVSLSFIIECCKYTQIDFHVILGRASKDLIKEQNYSQIPNLFFHLVDFHPGDSIYHFIKFKLILKKIEKKINPDSVISVFGPCYWSPKAKHIIGFANGYYLYEDSPYIKESKNFKGLFYSLKKLIHKLFLENEADFFWTETEDSKKRLSNFLKIDLNKIVVASNTPSSFFYNLKDNNKLAIFGNTKIKLLYVSSYYPHKNFEIIPQVYNNLLKNGYDVEFQITINQSDYSNNSLLKDCVGITNLGPIHPKDCPQVYSQCDIVFVPTLLEIFTAVYPEAMMSMKPIVTVDLGFAQTICGNAALYYNYSSAEDAANKIIELIENRTLANNLINLGLERLKQFDTPEIRFRKILNKIN